MDDAGGRAELTRAELSVLDTIDEQALVDDLVELIRVPSVTGTDAESDPDWESPPPGTDGCYRVQIKGEPMMQVDFTHHGEFGDHNVSGMITTAQRIINALPAVVAAKPGLVRAIDLPLVTGRGLVGGRTNTMGKP